MFGTRPDIHHIRTFGALAYVHVPNTPRRRREDDNALIGFVLGYSEDVVGCKVFKARTPRNGSLIFASKKMFCIMIAMMRMNRVSMPIRYSLHQKTWSKTGPKRMSQ
ncbi:TPA: hypothetical protein N0F65_010207 [Lagenidium giganteum]|uniref:Uncharacterized protein n=1 Tax=Lagenidium giganteum TaxID=4803 RepID=A0AAV2YZ91_9STRA|nr:TPA: hypothetical protein N0F65_010207 [Lagenidium giganteum]